MGLGTMIWSPHIQWEAARRHCVTGALYSQTPERCEEVISRITFTPQQMGDVLDNLQLHRQHLNQVTAERQTLSTQLEAATAAGDQREVASITKQLEANLARMNVVCTVHVACYLLLVSTEQLNLMGNGSFPANIICYQLFSALERLQQKKHQQQPARQQLEGSAASDNRATPVGEGQALMHVYYHCEGSEELQQVLAVAAAQPELLDPAEMMLKLRRPLGTRRIRAFQEGLQQSGQQEGQQHIQGVPSSAAPAAATAAVPKHNQQQQGMSVTRQTSGCVPAGSPFSLSFPVMQQQQAPQPHDQQVLEPVTCPASPFAFAQIPTTATAPFKWEVLGGPSIANLMPEQTQQSPHGWHAQQWWQSTKSDGSALINTQTAGICQSQPQLPHTSVNSTLHPNPSPFTQQVHMCSMPGDQLPTMAVNHWSDQCTSPTGQSRNAAAAAAGAQHTLPATGNAMEHQLRSWTDEFQELLLPATQPAAQHVFNTATAMQGRLSGCSTDRPVGHGVLDLSVRNTERPQRSLGLAAPDVPLKAGVSAAILPSHAAGDMQHAVVSPFAFNRTKSAPLLVYGSTALVIQPGPSLPASSHTVLRSPSLAAMPGRPPAVPSVQHMQLLPARSSAATSTSDDSGRSAVLGLLGSAHFSTRSFASSSLSSHMGHHHGPMSVFASGSASGSVTESVTEYLASIPSVCASYPSSTQVELHQNSNSNTGALNDAGQGIQLDLSPLTQFAPTEHELQLQIERYFHDLQE